jgi:hypothetical protein
MDTQQITTIAIQTNYSTMRSFSITWDFPCLSISSTNSLSQLQTFLSTLKPVIRPSI